MNRRSVHALLAASVCFIAQPLLAETITLTPSKDNTLYEDVAGAKSNGAGSYLFAGVTNTDLIRRAVLAFDLSASIPAGSTITSASLTLTVDRYLIPSVLELHAAQKDWGQGTSNALPASDLGGGGGSGTDSTPNDATWKHTFYDTGEWTNLGGDFASLASGVATISLVAVPFNLTFSSTTELIADVQSWVDTPASNFGWFVLGDESQTITGVRFRSSEHAIAANRPQLTIEFTPGTPVASTWSFPGSGDWANNDNWTGGVPNAPGAIVNLGSAIAADSTITLTPGQTVGALTFDNAAYRYTLSGDTLTLNSGAASDATVNVASGNHTITSALHLFTNTTVGVPTVAQTLTLGGDMTAEAGVTLTKTGAGVVEVKHVKADHLSISEGTVKVIAGGGANGTSRIKQLTIAGTTGAWTSKLDLTNNAMVIDYDVNSPIDTVKNQIKTAYAGGGLTAWTGNGITTSSGDAGVFGVGYAERSALTSVPAIFGPGLETETTAVLVRGTRFGDSDLDGDVDLDDVGRWSVNFTGELGGGAGSTKVWFNGDWDYDGDVDLDDVGRWSVNFTGELGGGAGLTLVVTEGINPTAMAALNAMGITVVPEPGVSALIILPGALLLRRRR